MFGSRNFLLLYLFAGLFASLTSLWWHPNVNSAGASGAIFGLLGGLLAFALNPATGVPPTIAANQRRSAFVFIAYNLFNGFTHQGIDNAAHLGGLVSGFLMGWMLAMPLDPEAREREASRWALSAAFGMAVLMALGWPLASRPHMSAAEVLAQATSRHSIAFYPGNEPVALNSGETVSAAMRAVYGAPDAAALNGAISAVRKMAESGDAEAAFRLGRYYHLETAEPNYALALKYYEIAANEDHAWATNNLGLMYRDGTGVARDDQKAYSYFLKASRENNSWAYLNLAHMTFAGRGVRADTTRALAWLEDGAAKNCTLCMIEEAAIYHSGAYGIHPDRKRTAWLLDKAAALGDAQAKLTIAKMHIVGDSVAQSSRTSFGILKSLSDDGNGDASNLLGELSADDKIRGYLFDTTLGGVRQMPADYTTAFPQDPATAMRYWKRADRQGNCQSLIDLSSVYDRGMGVSADYRKAAGYVARAVRCEPTNSFYLWKLGIRFDEGKGVNRDCEAARKLFAGSLDLGYADAGADLGYIYDKGCAPIARNDQRAFQIYLLCAKLGVPVCQNNVGAMLKHGRGVAAADPARGYGWIKLAALHGDELARANLGDPLFTPKVRAAGLLNLADIKRRLLAVPSDPQAIVRDPWY
jgi:TPR repeat protein